MPQDPTTASAPATEPPFLVFGAPVIGEAEIAEVVDTLRSGWLGTGPKAQRFEADLARYLGVPHVLALNSCTAGLHLALDALGIGPGDEVVTSPMTFVATANVIVHRGAMPVFADIDPRTGNLDPGAAAAALTRRTKALLVVHFAGKAAAMGPLCQLARAHGLAVVEDCAHALETLYHGAHAGTIGDVGAFSFYATKNLCTGEGGAISTARAELAARMRCRSQHGLSRDAWARVAADGEPRYDCLYPGYKYNMPDLQAAIGIHQLRRLEAAWRRRRELVEGYDAAFADLDGLRRPAPPAPGCRDAYHLYPVRLVPEAWRIDRGRLAVEMRALGIGTGIHFVPVHLQPWYRRTVASGPLPEATAMGETVLSLPLSPALTGADQARVVEAVRLLARRYRR